MSDREKLIELIQESFTRLIDADAITTILEEWEEKACDGTENDGSDGTTRVLHPVPTTTREMIDLIADQPTIETASQWIPVTERLPMESDADDAMGVCAIHKKSKKRYWHYASVKDNPFDFTHWMPLPDPVDHFREVRKMMKEDKIAQMTNANWIRALTDEELAEILQESNCPPTETDACTETCTKCWLKWLQQPVDAIALENLCTKSGIELQECETIQNLNDIFYPQSTVIETLKVKRENENG